MRDEDWEGLVAYKKDLNLLPSDYGPDAHPPRVKSAYNRPARSTYFIQPDQRDLPCPDPSTKIFLFPSPPKSAA
jgi:hypothetical protein